MRLFFLSSSRYTAVWELYHNFQVKGRKWDTNSSLGDKKKTVKTGLKFCLHNVQLLQLGFTDIEYFLIKVKLILIFHEKEEKKR